MRSDVMVRGAVVWWRGWPVCGAIACWCGGDYRISKLSSVWLETQSVVVKT